MKIVKPAVSLFGSRKKEYIFSSPPQQSAPASVTRYALSVARTLANAFDITQPESVISSACGNIGRTSTWFARPDAPTPMRRFPTVTGILPATHEMSKSFMRAIADHFTTGSAFDLPASPFRLNPPPNTRFETAGIGQRETSSPATGSSCVTCVSGTSMSTYHSPDDDASKLAWSDHSVSFSQQSAAPFRSTPRKRNLGTTFACAQNSQSSSTPFARTS